MKTIKALSFIFIFFFITACDNSNSDPTVESSNPLENNSDTSSASLQKTQIIKSVSDKNSAILFQASTVFQNSRSCFKKSSNLIGALSCANTWEDSVRTERQKLIKANFISQEEYDASKAIYNEKRMNCKEQSKRESTWFVSRKIIEYRCFRPVALAYMDSIIERFNCDTIAPLTDSI